MKRILFLCPYPFQQAPSQRFRYEQYLSQLMERGYNLEVKPFLSLKSYNVLYHSGNFFPKVREISYSYFKRLRILLHVCRYDFIFIHREATPVGPPIIEWLLANILRKKIIYDFDDAIWLTDRPNESFMLRLIKWRSKVKSICRWSYRISCGNHYLCSYASSVNRKVVYNPTTIDTETLHNPDLYAVERKQNHVTIGWTGTHSTLKYLYQIEPVLQKISEHFSTVEFIVIANKKPSSSFSGYRFIQWNGKTEIEDLLKFDIGIMPLPDDEWSKGKCGFKALQYMALKIPAVVSPVGVNTSIVEHGVNGFLANTTEEWFEYLSLLIQNDSLRKEMGEQGRKKIIECYSVESNATTFLSLFA